MILPRAVTFRSVVFDVLAQPPSPKHFGSRYSSLKLSSYVVLRREYVVLRRELEVLCSYLTVIYIPIRYSPSRYSSNVVLQRYWNDPDNVRCIVLV